MSSLNCKPIIDYLILDYEFEYVLYETNYELPPIYNKLARFKGCGHYW